MANGLSNRITGSNTINFIQKTNIPRNKKVTYANLVYDFLPLKSDQYRVRLTVGGDRLQYDKETASRAENLLETKILVNSVISDAKRGAKFMTMDIKELFLQLLLPEKEYMIIQVFFLTSSNYMTYKTK